MKNEINSGGTCIFCKTKSIHYGISRGNYTFRCLKCDKDLKKEEVLTGLQVKYLKK